MFVLQVNGHITNTGHSIVFTVENNTRHHINVTGGPLSYKYQFYQIHVHYGLQDETGSEHSINGYTFPAEVTNLSYVVSAHLSLQNLPRYDARKLGIALLVIFTILSLPEEFAIIP